MFIYNNNNNNDNHRCPYCHGFEVADSSFGVVSNGFPGFMVTQLLLSSWSKKVTFFSNGPLDLPEPQKQRLLSLGAVFHEEKIQKLSANGDKLEAVVLESGASVPIDYLFAHFPSVPLINEIAFKDMETPIVVNHDPKDVMMKGQTNVPGVYIAGDLVSMFHQLSHAAYTGTLAGALANNYLATL